MQIVKINVTFLEGDDIPATSPLDTALDSGNPGSSGDGHTSTSSKPANDEGQ